MIYTTTLIDKQHISIPTGLNLINRLAGSVPLSKKFKGLAIDQIIDRAITENHLK